MKYFFHKNNISRFMISAGAFIIALSILWSILSRATDIFLLSNQERRLITGIIFFISFLVSILFFWNQKIYNFILRKIKDIGHAFIIMLIFSALFSASLFHANLLPMLNVPANHTLIIQALTTNEDIKNVVYIENIFEVHEAIEIGNRLVDPANIQISDGEFSILNGEIILEEGALLHYSSFYLGCIRVSFKTSPESRKVFVQFDREEGNFLLHSLEDGQTEVNMCSRNPLDTQSLRWKLISIGNYFLNIIALTSFFGLELFLIFYNKRVDHNISIRKAAYKEKTRN